MTSGPRTILLAVPQRCLHLFRIVCFHACVFLVCAAQQTSAPASLAQARMLMQQRRFTEADRLLRPLIAADPHAAEPRYLLAYALIREDKPADSLHEYTQAAALRSPNAAELRDVALAYVLLNDLPDADRWLTRSLSMDSHDADTWYDMGRLRYTQGRYGDAAACFQKTLSLNPRSMKAENNLGLAYEALNRNDDALAAYRNAVAWQKNDPSPSEQPLLNLAILLLHRNQLSEAQQLLEQAAALAPKEPRICENLGQIYLRTGRPADAIRQFAAAVSLAPKNPRYHFLLGQAYRKNGNRSMADQEFAQSEALNGTHSTPDRQ